MEPKAMMSEYSSTMNTTEEYANSGMPQSFNYAEYRELINALLLQDQVTGTEQSQEHLDFTKLNVVRMNRWDKHGKLTEEMSLALDSIKNQQTWLVISEGWCGDSAQIVPFFNLIAEYQPLINFRIVIRDEHDELMEANLTNGTRSIPKLIVMDHKGKQLFTWGPRPIESVQLMKDWKLTMPIAEAKEKLHLWYARNGGVALQTELAALVRSTAL